MQNSVLESLCSLCFQRYDGLSRRPSMIISCGHCFCEECLKQLENSQRQAIIVCPECQKPVRRINVGGVLGWFQPNRQVVGSNSPVAPLEAACTHQKRNYICMDPACPITALACLKCTVLRHVTCPEEFLKSKEEIKIVLESIPEKSALEKHDKKIQDLVDEASEGFRSRLVETSSRFSSLFANESTDRSVFPAQIALEDLTDPRPGLKIRKESNTIVVSSFQDQHQAMAHHLELMEEMVGETIPQMTDRCLNMIICSTAEKIRKVLPNVSQNVSLQATTKQKVKFLVSAMKQFLGNTNPEEVAQATRMVQSLFAPASNRKIEIFDLENSYSEFMVMALKAFLGSLETRSISKKSVEKKIRKFFSQGLKARLSLTWHPKSDKNVFEGEMLIVNIERLPEILMISSPQTSKRETDSPKKETRAISPASQPVTPPPTAQHPPAQPEPPANTRPHRTGRKCNNFWHWLLNLH